MKALGTHWVTHLLAAALAALVLWGTSPAQAQDVGAFDQQQLDQMLAPVALYPDALLSQLLMAATYPIELEQAQRWSAANTRLVGAQAVQAVSNQDWDPSVMSMVAFPQILRTMAQQRSWTLRLGDAFLGQEQQVMDTVQALRHRAYAAGHLRSSDRQRIDWQGDDISIAQADAVLFYEPYYNTSIVYGNWWWPQSAPVYWAPWAGYRERPGFDAFMWGGGIALGANFFFGQFDWGQHRTNVVTWGNRNVALHSGASVAPPRQWQHEPQHRRAAPYRQAAARERFGAALTPLRPRSEFRGHPAPIAAPQPQQQVAPAPLRLVPPSPPPQGHPAAPAPLAPAARPVPAPAPSGHADVRRGARPPMNVAPPAAARAHALEDLGQAQRARDFSARGRASQQSARPVVPAPMRATAPTVPVVRAPPVVRPAPPAAPRGPAPVVAAPAARAAPAAARPATARGKRSVEQ